MITGYVAFHSIMLIVALIGGAFIGRMIGMQQGHQLYKPREFAYWLPYLLLLLVAGFAAYNGYALLASQ